MFGREYRTPLDLTLNISTDRTSHDLTDYTAQLKERIRAAYTAVNEHMKSKTQRMKNRYDAKDTNVSVNTGRICAVLLSTAKTGTLPEMATAL